MSWTRVCGWFTAVGIMAVSIVNPLVSSTVFTKWFGSPYLLLLLLIPLMCFASLVIVDRYLSRFSVTQNDKGCWIPFVGVVFIFVLSFLGLGYSYFPYVVPGEMTVWEAASASESLWFILYGALIVLPAIIIYTVFSYRVFWGKTKELAYY